MALHHVTAAFRHRAAAEHALNALRQHGYRDSDVNVVMSDETRRRHYVDPQSGAPQSLAHDGGSQAIEGMGVGGAIGTAIGATIAALAAVGTTLAIPGLGLVIAGPLVAALAGGGAGAVTGGFIGALVGLGIPEQQAVHYQSALQEGGVILNVTARSESEARDLENAMRQNGGEHVHST